MSFLPLSICALRRPILLSPSLENVSNVGNWDPDRDVVPQSCLEWTSSLGQ
jgi:hypothetical protein